MQMRVLTVVASIGWTTVVGAVLLYMILGPG
jgi:hypothetical protein